MDEILRRSLLFDFYGELLTDHRREIYGEYIQEDLSLSEIAQEHGVTRQSVFDLVKKCEKTLEEFEAKLGLVERFQRTGIKAEKIHRLVQEADEGNRERILAEIDSIALSITEDL